jgi:hypothetical protein
LEIKFEGADNFYLLQHLANCPNSADEHFGDFFELYGKKGVIANCDGPAQEFGHL